MRLGVISDTHGRLPNEVFEVFEQVDLILHAGDIGHPDILTALRAVAPVTAVHGNTDGFDIRSLAPEVVVTRIEGFDFLLLHGHQFGQPSAESVHAAYPDAEVIIFGHTHKALLAVVDQVVTVMNPGSAGAPRDGMPPSVGILELEAGIPPRGRLIPLLGETF